eukprot:COSAG06_NODE_4556_length_4151_cov_1.692744_2_plen_126_part_00
MAHHRQWRGRHPLTCAPGVGTGGASREPRADGALAAAPVVPGDRGEEHLSRACASGRGRGSLRQLRPGWLEGRVAKRHPDLLAEFLDLDLPGRTAAAGRAEPPRSPRSRRLGKNPSKHPTGTTPV